MAKSLSEYALELSEADLIAEARSLVPELAKRLQIACNLLKAFGMNHLPNELQSPLELDH